MRTTKTYNLILTAVFTAVTAVLSGLSITIPVTPVPISLATLGVLLSGGILGKKYGSIAMLTYTLLGSFGLPIFSGYEGGLSKLVGPTGGYIIGYIACAFIIGVFVEYSEKRFSKPNLLLIIAGAILGMIACFTLGTAYFMLQTKTSLIAAIGMCVLPFLIGDFVKISLASILILKLRPLHNMYIQKSVSSILKNDTLEAK